jgi:Leucine-rich repeat (LRR) protein
LPPVYLQNNALTQLDVNTFLKTQIVALQLGNNSLTTLPLGIFTASMQQITLSNNSFSTIPLGLFNNVGLRSLDLSYNYLSTFSAGLFDTNTMLGTLSE